MAKRKFPVGIVVTAGIFLILILGLALIFKDFILFNFLTSSQFDKLTPGDCTFNIDDNSICVGDYVRATLVDGENADCIIAYKLDDSGWRRYKDVTTDQNGRFTESQTVGKSGTYIFAVICDDGNEKCRTNDEKLIVNICSSTDSDGDGYTDEEEIEAGTDPNDPDDYPSFDEEDFSQYTCGQSEDSCYGTCPSTYPTCTEVWTGLYTWACMCVNEDTESVHPEWKPGGSMYNEHTVPECYSDNDCGDDYFCFEGSCEPRCISYYEDYVRTNYLGTSYGACWEICGGDKDCCDSSYKYYDGATFNGEQWYYYACEWYEPQSTCGNTMPCKAPGGNHP